MKSIGLFVIAILIAVIAVFAVWRSGETDNTDPVKKSPVQKADLQFFSDASPWNQKVEDKLVDPRSDYLMLASNERIGVDEAYGDVQTSLQPISEGVFINSTSWSPPVVSGGELTQLTCRQSVCKGDPDSLPIPSDVDPDPRYDGWLTVIQGDTAYDLWRARRLNDNSISYQYMRTWDLKGLGYGKPSEIGVRGSGMPLFAGTITDKEIEQGSINHALSIALPGVSATKYVQPASTTDGNGQDDSLPMGARIRLKANIRLPEYDSQGTKLIYTREQRRRADIILLALKKYGAIVSERATVPTLYAVRDTQQVDGNELEGLRPTDFEVVQLGKVSKYNPIEEIQ